MEPAVMGFEGSGRGREFLYPRAYPESLQASAKRLKPSSLPPRL